ncbi:MAG: FKBP-type peptidyl-prolyl cis-trans isomerase [Prevotella sp.]|nr:FKBP-type peptidyl-prolyl cis-trans isomerase [Prevotella sp.]
MKKLTFVASMALAAAVLSSCGSRLPKASMKSDVDSLSYAIGVQIGEEFNQYDALTQSFGVDSAYISDFIRGISDAVSSTDEKKQNAYMAGLQVANILIQRYLPQSNQQYFGEDSTQQVSKENLVAAFTDIVLGNTALVTSEQAQEILSSFTEKQNEKRFGDNRRAGEAFLAENATKDSVTVLPSGLQYKILTAGTGATPADTSRVKVDYEGRLIDGTVFDSSYQRGEPTEFGVTQVIPGWTEALKLMPVGSEWEIYIPQELAYGAQQAGPVIKPFSALVFKVKLLEIK